MKLPEPQYLTVKEMAAAIGKSRFFVHAAKTKMREQGIEWPMGQFTVGLFREWCARYNFRCTFYRGQKRDQGSKKPA